MQELPEALRPLAAYPQFIVWRAEARQDGSGKVDKFPISAASGQIADAHNPAIWLNADAAILAAQSLNLGVGFVITSGDPFYFIDIDHCLNESGQWSPVAVQLCEVLNGAAIEISQSGRGLHIIGSGQFPEHRCKSKIADVDLYTEGRFVALTGHGIKGSASAIPPPEVIPWLVNSYFPPGPELDPSEWTERPTPEWNGPEDDDELVERMLSSRSAGSLLGGKASPYDLWIADEDVLGRCFPPDNSNAPFDHSRADAALCQHLAFWTGKDCARIERLFSKSALGKRDKWNERGPYRRETILKAVGLCSQVYSRSKPGADTEAVDGIRTGFQYCSVTHQVELFAGCCYVRDLHRVFTPDGALLKSEQFRAAYGGRVFALDSLSDKTTRNAWEVFTESQAFNFPKAHGVCFRPEETPGAMLVEEGRTLINTYTPIDTSRSVGDPSPFLNHLALQIPNELDRAILLAYMAACVQHKGSKFQWAPLLQGMEGNGKSLIGRVLTAAIGNRYTHKVNPKDIGNVFNAWVSGKLLAIVEEVYTRDRGDIIDTLKWLITDDKVPVTSKGVDQITGDNRANFILTTNHKDAIRKTVSDRRYFVLYTAQQNMADMQRDGMIGDYFPNLYNWLRNGGYAILNEYFSTYQIPVELNPALDRGGKCDRAPDSSSTAEAIYISLGGIEQEILEAVAEGRPGFAGGWVSSMQLDNLVKDRRDDKRVPHNKRKEILEGLGYIPHPALRDGRVDNTVMPDNGKPRLYLKRGHISANIEKPADVARAYMQAQGVINAAEPAVIPSGCQTLV